MIIECPSCGKEVDFNQYSHEDELCFSCLSTIDDPLDDIIDIAEDYSEYLVD